MSLEALFCTLIVDTHERHDVDNFDVSGEYLHKQMPNYKMILMKIGGVVFVIMCQVDPEYKQHVIYENGKEVL